MSLPWPTTVFRQTGRKLLYLRAGGERESQEEKQIFVDTGLESDYYVEISGEELEENMRVLLPIAQVQQEDSDAKEPGEVCLTGT